MSEQIKPNVKTIIEDYFDNEVLVNRHNILVFKSDLNLLATKTMPGEPLAKFFKKGEFLLVTRILDNGAFNTVDVNGVVRTFANKADVINQGHTLESSDYVKQHGLKVAGLEFCVWSPNLDEEYWYIDTTLSKVGKRINSGEDWANGYICSVLNAFPTKELALRKCTAIRNAMTNELFN